MRPDDLCERSCRHVLGLWSSCGRGVVGGQHRYPSGWHQMTERRKMVRGVQETMQEQAEQIPGENIWGLCIRSLIYSEHQAQAKWRGARLLDMLVDTGSERNVDGRRRRTGVASLFWARLLWSHVILVYAIRTYAVRTATEDGCREVVWTAFTNRHVKPSRVMISSQNDARRRSV